MRYRVLSVAAVLVFAGSLYLFCTKLTGLLDTGTCASGGPYAISRPCPEGTGTDVLLLMSSIFGLFVAAALAGLRGPRPGGGGFGFNSMMVTGWALFFTISGGVSLYHSLTSDVIGPDGKTGGIIVGATFLVMGVPVLLFVPKLIAGARRSARDGETVYAGDAPAGEGWMTTLRTGSQLMREAATGGGSDASPNATGSSGFSFESDSTGGGDKITQLERLQRLRESGALTEAEFAAEKARILSSGR